MKVKKIKCMCAVRGCNRTDSFAITKSGEFGGVVMCEECVRAALAAIENGGYFEPTRKPLPNTPLFFHPSATCNADTTTKATPSTEILCPECGKVCKNQSALIAHRKSHKNGDDND